MTCYKPLDCYKCDDLDPLTRKPYPYFYSLSKVPKGTSYQLVRSPCGRCIGCRLDYSRQWAIRCMHEAQMHEKNCFITLTYDDLNLPLLNGKWPTLDYRHWQLFMKKLRKRFGNGIRVYPAGEYGTKLGRPHFHAIVFGWCPHDLKFWKNSGDFPLFTSQSLSDVWGKGFVSVGGVTFQSAAYVARYIMKKQSGEGAKKYIRTEIDPETGEVFEFRIAEESAKGMSRRSGIGLKWIEKNYKHVYARDSVIVDGKQVRPPLFYDNYVKRLNKNIEDLEQSVSESDFQFLMDKYDFEIIDFDEIVSKRKIKMMTQKNVDNNSRERLMVRETVKQAQISKLVRVVD